MSDLFAPAGGWRVRIRDLSGGAEDGIVGAYNGSSAREVLYTPEQWAQLKQPAAT